MKLVSYLNDGHDQLAILVDGFLYDMGNLHPDLPNNMSMFLQYWEDAYPMALGGEMMIREGKLVNDTAVPFDSVELLAPVPFPSSFRDGYAFRKHVAAARRNRKAEMIPEFDQYPIFYFSNHHGIKGAGEIACMPDHFENLDFELEIAIVISKQGRNIKAEDADEFIAGLMILNDFSARRLQTEEMLFNLGPAKGKDFATATGPWLVTPDELQNFEIAPGDGHTGKNWNLRMQGRVNGIQVSDGNAGDMNWTFAELIERASYGVDLHPGDIIGSGTVGSGCFLELNGTAKLNDPGYEARWLKEGDIIELEVDGLGVLSNYFIKAESEFSILAIKKNV